MLLASFRHISRQPSLRRALSYGKSGAGDVVASFKDVTFGHVHDRPLLLSASFGIRKGAKVTLMGQNGAGKSSILGLIAGSLTPHEGLVSLRRGETVATARQTVALEQRPLTVRDFFAGHFDTPPGHTLEPKIAKALHTVNLVAPLDRIISSFSGGQQARLLLAAALVTDPSIVCCDEPTNNLDTAGIERLRTFIQNTDKTCLVISHDEAFLNSFTDSVLYLDIFTKKVEMYDGDYNYVKEEISARIARENSNNQRLMKEAQKKKDQANVFANKGGGMRKVAKKMRDVAAEWEEQVVDVRKEDAKLASFDFPFTNGDGTGALLEITRLTTRCPATGDMVDEELKSGSVRLTRGSRVQVVGPNGIGKTTFLDLIAKGTAKGVKLNDGARIGYYRQDFSNLDFNATALECLENASKGHHTPQELRGTAGRFLLRGDIVKQQVRTLSEGQKALLSMACLVLEEPTILVCDEPSNHLNFRHLPAVAKAVANFEGAVLLVSHDDHFVQEVGVSHVIDMGYELGRSA